MSKGFTFIDLDLQAGDYTTVNAGIFSAPPTKQKTVDVARGDGEVSMFLGYGARSWEHEGTIRAESSDALELSIDTLKRYMHRKGVYAFEYAGGMRYIQATLRNVVISRAANEVSRCGFSAEFYAEDPFMTNGEEATIVNENITQGSQTIAIDVDGTYLGLAVYQLEINSIDPDDTEVEITISNAIENHTLTITGIFQAGDVITVNCLDEEVYVNDTLTNAAGLFPLFAPGGGSFTYQDNADSRDIDILGTYDKRYL